MGTLPPTSELVLFIWNHAGIERIFASRDDVVTLREWTGTEWIEVGLTIGGSEPEILALGSVDESLLICGEFDSANGEPAEGLVRWDGSEFDTLTFEPVLAPGSSCKQLAAEDVGIAPGAAQFRVSASRGEDFIYQWTPPGPAKLIPPPSLTSSEGPGVFGLSGPLTAGPEGSRGFVIALPPGQASDTRSPLFVYLNERWVSVAEPVDGLGLASVDTLALVDINGGTELVAVADQGQPLEVQLGAVPAEIARLKNGRWEGVVTPGPVSFPIVRTIQNEVRLYSVLQVLQDFRAIGRWTSEGFVPVDATPFDGISRIEVAERDGQEVFYYVVTEPTELSVNEHTVQGWRELSGARSLSFESFRAFDAGNGAQLYAAGEFEGASGLIENLGRHNGVEWEDPGYPGLAPISFLEVVQWQGKQQLLVAASGQTNLASSMWLYDGVTWTPLNGPGPTGFFRVHAALTVDSCLLVGGDFRLDVEPQEGHFIHRYCNDIVGWTQVFDPFDDSIRSMAARPDVGDASLWVGGDFSASREVAAKRIAKGVLFRLFVDSFETDNSALF